MKLVKEYLCDGSTPDNKEIKECLEIANKEDCIVRLRWCVGYGGWYERIIQSDMSFAEIKDNLPKCYGV